MGIFCIQHSAMIEKKVTDSPPSQTPPNAPSHQQVSQPPSNIGQQVIQIVIIPATRFPSIDDNLLLLLLLLFRHRAQQLLQLLLCDLGPQLARLGEHDESVFDIGRARFFDEPDAAEAVSSFGSEDLSEDGVASIGFALSVFIHRLVSCLCLSLDDVDMRSHTSEHLLATLQHHRRCWPPIAAAVVAVARDGSEIRC